MNYELQKWGTWAGPPPPVTEREVVEELTADVVVAGAGMAGTACALRAAQGGLDVLVLEKTAGWSARGGNIGVANSAFMKAGGFENDIDAVAREWIKRCGNRCDEEIVRLYLENGGRAMDWLVELLTRPEYGARPALQSGIYRGETYRELIGSHRFFDGPMAKKGMRPGGADAVYAMYSESVRHGARYRFKTPGEQLLMEEGRVTGIYAKTDGGYLRIRARRGVVLATGDIGGNEAMCEDLSPIANRCAAKVYSPRGGNSGDGHRMGLWAGGAFEDTPFPAILHTQAYHFRNYCFLFVRPDGTRFMSEDNYVQGKSVAVIREKIPYAWSIMDGAWEAKVPATLPYGGGLFWSGDTEVGGPDFDLEEERRMLDLGLRRGVVVRGDTPEELAERMGVPAGAFTATLGEYNAMAANGRDTRFGKRKELLFPLDTPPYYGMKFAPALLAVVGGLRVDTGMRVLREDGHPVGGLYAIGNTAGGRYGVDYPIVIAGNSHGTALTFGFLLGEALAAHETGIKPCTH